MLVNFEISLEITRRPLMQLALNGVCCVDASVHFCSNKSICSSFVAVKVCRVDGRHVGEAVPLLHASYIFPSIGKEL